LSAAFSKHLSPPVVGLQLSRRLKKDAVCTENKSASDLGSLKALVLLQTRILNGFFSHRSVVSIKDPAR
jgi:hypothetical protein